MGRNFGFEILKFKSALGAFGYLFSQRRYGAPRCKVRSAALRYLNLVR